MRVIESKVSVILRTGCVPVLSKRKNELVVEVGSCLVILSGVEVTQKPVLCCGCKTTEERSSWSRNCCSASSCRRSRPVLWRLESSSRTCCVHKRLTLYCVCVCWATSCVSCFVVFLSDLLLARTCVDLCKLCTTPLCCFWYILSAREIELFGLLWRLICKFSHITNFVRLEIVLFHHSSHFHYCYCPYTFCCNKLHFYISVCVSLPAGSRPHLWMSECQPIFGYFESDWSLVWFKMVVGQTCLCNLHAILSGLAVIVFKRQAGLGERDSSCCLWTLCSWRGCVPIWEL